MNSKAILLATAVFSAALSVTAMADSYYFRSKGSPVAMTPDEGAENPPVEQTSASISLLADKYRTGTTISGTLDTSLANPAWYFAQTPAEPSLNLTTVSGGVTATAPAVHEPTTFQVSATATEDDKSANAGPASVTIHPLLAVSRVVTMRATLHACRALTIRKVRSVNPVISVGSI